MVEPHPFGVKIIFDLNALETTNERLFPASKNRSARIRKKLIKRYGGEFRKRPAMFKTPLGIIAHPSFRAQLLQADLPQGAG